MAIKCGRANAEIDVFGHLAGGMVGDDEQAGAGRAGNHFMRLGNHRSDRTSGLLVRPSDVMKRSEEHTSELQSLMSISYAGFCLKKKKTQQMNHTNTVTMTHIKP